MEISRYDKISVQFWSLYKRKKKHKIKGWRDKNSSLFGKYRCWTNVIYSLSTNIIVSRFDQKRKHLCPTRAHYSICLRSQLQQRHCRRHLRYFFFHLQLHFTRTHIKFVSLLHLNSNIYAKKFIFFLFPAAAVAAAVATIRSLLALRLLLENCSH